VAVILAFLVAFWAVANIVFAVLSAVAALT
jgi:hypothetical protein